MSLGCPSSSTWVSYGDGSASLYYLRARFYSPGLGRFLTQDTYLGEPREPWTQHLYAYVGNNPVNYVDPTGHIRQINMDGGSSDGREQAAERAEQLTEKHDQERAFEKFKAQEIAERISSESSSEHYGGWTKEQFELYKKAYSNVNQSGLGSCSESLECSGIVLGVTLGGPGIAYVMSTPAATALMQPSAVGTEEAIVTKAIGKFPAHLNLAKEMKSVPFNLPMSVYEKLTPAQQWAANQKFLDRAIAKGAEFVLASPVSAANAGSGFAKEIQYLVSQGYRFVDNAGEFGKFVK